MRAAAIYDIHGDLPALEAVLQEIRHEGVDRVLVGGDIVPGPMPQETVSTLVELRWATRGTASAVARGTGRRRCYLVHAVRRTCDDHSTRFCCHVGG